MIARVRGVIAAVDRGRVDVERDRIDVDEPRRRADARDAAGGREERERRRDDLVAGTDAERHQRDEQRVGARRQADGVRDAEVGRHLALERLDLGAADEPLAVGDPRHRGEDFVADRPVLRLQIQERDGHRQRPASSSADHRGAPERQVVAGIFRLAGGTGARVEDDVHLLARVGGEIDGDRDPAALRRDWRAG